MSRISFRLVLRLLWATAAISLSGALALGIGATVRLWLLAALALLALPSSLLTVPAANWLVGRLNMESPRSIDAFVSTITAACGYVQWFVLPAFYNRNRKEPGWLSRAARQKERDAVEQGSSATADSSAVIFYGDDSESLSLKMLLEGSGIEASLRNFSMSGGGLGPADVRVFVKRDDVDRAKPLVEEFETELRRSRKRQPTKN